MDEQETGIRVRRSAARREGSCNFCDSWNRVGDHEVIVVHPANGGFTARFCDECAVQFVLALDYSEEFKKRLRASR